MVCGTGMNQCSLSINTHVDTATRYEHSLEVDFYAKPTENLTCNISTLFTRWKYKQ